MGSISHRYLPKLVLIYLEFNRPKGRSTANCKAPTFAILQLYLTYFDAAVGKGTLTDLLKFSHIPAVLSPLGSLRL